MINLLRRAWDTLDAFKQAYPENWHEEDEQVLKDLMRSDLQLSGVKLKWQGLTKEEAEQLVEDNDWYNDPVGFCFDVEAKLKEKNT